MQSKRVRFQNQDKAQAKIGIANEKKKVTTLDMIYGSVTTCILGQ